MSGDLWSYTTRRRVVAADIDDNGHVNNATYLTWVAALTGEHADACGFGREWSITQGGVWFVRRHDITYHRPALLDDELELTVEVQSIGGARGVRRTEIVRPSDRASIADCTTEWVWVRLPDGRPARVPQAIRDAYANGP